MSLEVSLNEVMRVERGGAAHTSSDKSLVIEPRQNPSNADSQSSALLTTSGKMSHTQM